MQDSFKDEKVVVMKIHIARLYYPVTTLGPGNRCVIWTTGCPRHCDGCISEELRHIEYGNAIEVNELIQFIHEHIKNLDGFTISGGEPFYQLDALEELISALHMITSDIIIYTGYRYEDLLNMNDDRVFNVFDNISVLIDGPYIKELDDGKGIRGSTNQKYICLDDQYDMNKIFEQRRAVQTVIYEKKMLEIGVPGGRR